MMTNKQIAEILNKVKDGADIYSYTLACFLREIERSHPDLIDICKPRRYDGDGADQTPYFGCITTAAGINFIKQHGGDQ